MKASLEQNTTQHEVISAGSMLTDRLEVVRRLGSGGMGDVYEVQHKFTKHRRAVKVLHAQHRNNPEVVERFLREASAAGRIGNPHIVETFDAGMLPDGSPFIVMEFLEGKPLGDVLRWNGRLDPALASALMVQVCEAVQAAHDANIIHRDLKPENLFLTERDGRAFVKVLDFGISKFQAEEGIEMRITRSGLTMGTPLYMAPEQLRGAKNVDVRSDVYSLGVILYEMVAGTAPFVADSFAELAVRVLTAEPRPLVQLDGAVPAQLSELVNKAIQKEPANRIPSAQAFADALVPFAKNSSVSVLLQHDVVPAAPAERPDGDTMPPAAARGATPSPATSPMARPSATPAVVAPVSPAPPAARTDGALRLSDLHAVRAPRPKWPLALVVVALLGAFGAWRFSGADVEPPAPEKQPPPTVVAEKPAAPVLAPEPTAVPKVEVAPAPSPETPPAIAVAAPAPQPVAKTARPSGKTKSSLKAAPAAVDAPPPPPLVAVEPQAERPPGIVNLNCTPVACTIDVDGVPAGETPKLNLKLKEGEHEVRFVNSETGAVMKRKFEVKSGEKTTVGQRW